ncbi:MAG: class I SAM-dependent methyltransferase [Parvibaculum sedimenti]|uniref:class I SAM-dependent methyltransferase n=1 Tax=Parvibaculum sedimenti TaxID=2608632 RepID=UPI003BB7D3C2
MTTDYDQIAEQFSAVIDRIPGNQFYERPATISLLPPLKDIDVLDAGCGSGFYTEYAHKAGARVVAFDPSKGMVEQAIKRVGTGCEIHCCKSSDLDAIMAGRKFDLVLSNLVMHYVQDLKVEFSRLEQMLKTDGKMIVSMKHPILHIGFIQKFGYRAVGLVRPGWDWAGGPVEHVQRPMGAITSAIYEAGLLIEQLIEAEPAPEMEKVDPAGYALAKRVPFFVHFVLVRRRNAGEHPE